MHKARILNFRNFLNLNRKTENGVKGNLFPAGIIKLTELMTTDIKQLRLQKMVEEVEDYAILLLDKEGNIENWNKGAEKTKGYKASEIIGKHYSIFYPPEE